MTQYRHLPASGGTARRGLVADRKDGRSKFYRIEPDALDEVAEWLGSFEDLWQDHLTRLGALLNRRRVPPEPCMATSASSRQAVPEPRAEPPIEP